MIRNFAAIKHMNDSDFDALGVRVLHNFCADLVLPLPESEEEDDTSENVVVRSSEPGCEDRLESKNIPKRKWKWKIYPDSVAWWSARIRTAKKIP